MEKVSYWFWGEGYVIVLYDYDTEAEGPHSTSISIDAGFLGRFRGPSRTCHVIGTDPSALTRAQQGFIKDIESI